MFYNCTTKTTMKKTVTRFLSACFTVCSVSAFAQLTPELLYYNFNGSGTSVPNLATSPPPGTTTATIMGGVTQGGSGICRGTLIGSGVSSTTDYLNTGWAPNLGSGAWTISFRTSGISTNATLYYIFGDVNTASFRCFTNGIAGSTNWVIRGAGMTDVYINGGALSTPTMCTYVYDPTLANIKGYLNGVLVSTVAQGAVNLTGAGPLKVMGYSANVGAPAGGMLDEFRLYSRALTAAEVLQLYNPFTPSGFLGSDVNICTGDSVELQLNWPTSTVAWSNGGTADSSWFTSAGNATVSVSGACGTGMDTVLIINGESTSSMSPTGCGLNYTAPSGAVYTTSGTYMDTIPNMAGCDSVITINLTLTNPTSSSFSATACSMYTTPSGAMVMSSGTYMDTIPNMAGCDSVMTINVTINQPSSSSFSATACDMYTAPSGAMYMSSGTYMDTIPNMAGCDSVMTINVTVNASTSSSMSASACDMYTAPSGATYTISGTYMDTIPNMAGCDSVMTINLAVTYSTTNTVSPVLCDASYTAPSGAVYSVSGTYMDTIPNMAGCDSVTTINLTVNNSTTNTMTITACDMYTAPSGAVYTTSGVYMDTIPNMAGCDSVITINATINTVNVGTTLTGVTITASASGATYQWINCAGNTPIAGATSQSYTATANGNYAVIVTQNSCTDTSACQNVNSIGMMENTFGSNLNLYPNPSKGEFFVDLGGTYSDVVITISDVAGRVIYTQNSVSANIIPVNLDAPAGLYIITLTAENHKAIIKLVKE
ncbi:MAG: hypothetical protein FD123_3431 [Bacteroidetes bacterium]|nr:MAG: hypothetical protein FD123_3431 [Bacteroidota bacterium]